MTHHIDINNVQSVEVEPVTADLFSAAESSRHCRRIVVRTQFGTTTIILHAASATDLELSTSGGSPSPDGPPG